MTKDEYKKLNEYLNGCFIELEKKDRFLLNNLLIIDKFSCEFIKTTDDYDLKEAAKKGTQIALSDDNSSRYNKESALFKNKWKDVLEKGDPYYNVNFSLDRSDFSLTIHKKEKQ